MMEGSWHSTTNETAIWGRKQQKIFVIRSHSHSPDSLLCRCIHIAIYIYVYVYMYVFLHIYTYMKNMMRICVGQENK